MLSLSMGTGLSGLESRKKFLRSILSFPPLAPLQFYFPRLQFNFIATPNYVPLKSMPL
jgi:hypothetical protein